MSVKFGRIYQMTAMGSAVNLDGEPVTYTIEYPLTMKFQVTTNNLYSLGSGTFLIYNLTADIRNNLYKDFFEYAIYRPITFAAGYRSITSPGGGISLPVIFQGNIQSCYSYRQGPDWITEIHALDGGHAITNASIALTKPAPYSFSDVMTDVVNVMKPFNLSLGLIGAFDFPHSRGITFNGNPWDLITQTVLPFEGKAYINKEKVYILQQWEYIQDEGFVTTISDDIGMIGTPQLQENLVKARLLFEPRFEIGQRVHLDTSQTRMKGDYTVQSLVHAGTISGAVCETLTTEVTLYQPDRESVEVTDEAIFA